MLKADINQCQYFDGVRLCNAPHTKCGMLIKLIEEEKSKDKYVRKERWYEKYYRDR